ncbi:MAG: undecaprenyl-diphosphate phosphatase [Alphaproteobacteria bacterium]
MDAMTFKAVILGIIEGLTEYLPVSSTGHLLLAEHFLGLNFEDATLDKTFTVLVQLGSILALVLVYVKRLLQILLASTRDKQARNFIFGILLAFLPAAVVGAVLHGFIKGVLFNPLIVCIALIAGGFILLLVDELPLERKHHDATRFPLSMAFKIGIIQCIAMIPGVSRSGATIVGAMALGADKRAAAEFSFFLAIPTMVGAFAYDLMKSYKDLTLTGTSLIAIGFVAAFISGLIVVTSLLRYVSRHGFAVFAWWRIIIGAAGLAGLLVFG